MSNRERWIVYPLLFFALLLGLKEQMTIPMDAEYRHLKCNKLTVEALDERPLVELSSSIESEGDQAGLLVMYGPIAGDESGTRVGMDTTPRPRTVELGSEPGGGYFKSYGPVGAHTIKVGHNLTERTSGVVAVDDHGQLVPQSAAPTEGQAWGPVIAWDKQPMDDDASSEDGPREDSARKDTVQESGAASATAAQ